MQGDVVIAAKWLGGSIVLASAILIGGLRWLQSVESARPHRSSGSPTGFLTSTTRAGEALDEGATDATLAMPPVVAIASTSTTPVKRDVIPEERAHHVCPNPPTEDEVWNRIPKSKGDGVSPTTARRDTAVFLVEKVGEHIDPGKTYPATGPTRLVHCHYKCTVGFDETSQSEYPIPFNHVDHRVEVVYLDKDHLRHVPAPAVATNRR
jgi:hypothetical protein